MLMIVRLHFNNMMSTSLDSPKGMWQRQNSYDTDRVLKCLCLTFQKLITQRYLVWWTCFVFQGSWNLWGAEDWHMMATAYCIRKATNHRGEYHIIDLGSMAALSWPQRKSSARVHHILLFFSGGLCHWLGPLSSFGIQSAASSSPDSVQSTNPNCWQHTRPLVEKEES